MTNNMWIKDWLILLSIHPKSGKLQKSAMMGYMLTAAALCDLVIIDKLQEESGNITIRQGETGDPVLDLLLLNLRKYDGTKTSAILSQQISNAHKLLKLQLTHLIHRRHITETPNIWMGITWGKRYRLTRPNITRPWITRFDRVLIYGRKPDEPTSIIIGLLGILGLQDHFYSDKEQKKRAISRVKELSKGAPENFHPLFNLIMKQSSKVAKQKQSGT